MKFSLTKLKSAFGKSKINEVQQDDTYISDIIKSIEQKPFAISIANVCYVSANELAGYYFLQTIIVGKFKIKTFKGAQLKINGRNFELELESDMMELESEHSKVTNSYVTRIDFVLNEKDLPKINKSSVNSLILSENKQSVEFSIIQTDDEEE